jgi:hypothetical protein
MSEAHRRRALGSQADAEGGKALKDNILVIHHRDNVAVALRTLARGVPGICKF